LRSVEIPTPISEDLRAYCQFVSRVGSLDSLPYYPDVESPFIESTREMRQLLSNFNFFDIKPPSVHLNTMMVLVRLALQNLFASFQEQGKEWKDIAVWDPMCGNGMTGIALVLGQFLPGPYQELFNGVSRLHLSDAHKAAFQRTIFNIETLTKFLAEYKSSHAFEMSGRRGSEESFINRYDINGNTLNVHVLRARLDRLDYGNVKKTVGRYRPDLVLTDPPYGNETYLGGRTGEGRTDPLYILQTLEPWVSPHGMIAFIMARNRRKMSKIMGGEELLEVPPNTHMRLDGDFQQVSDVEGVPTRDLYIWKKSKGRR
jgi:hypothetical protein